MPRIAASPDPGRGEAEESGSAWAGLAPRHNTEEFVGDKPCEGFSQHLIVWGANRHVGGEVERWRLHHSVHMIFSGEQV